jgi:hypothetical protein
LKHSVEQLSERVTCLERKARSLKIVNLVLLLTLAALGIMGQSRAPQKVVEAEAFVLKDPKGEERARLAMDDFDSVKLALTANRGMSAAELYVGTRVARFTMRSGIQEPFTMGPGIWVEAGLNSSRMAVGDAASQPGSISLNVASDEEPSLKLFDAQFKPRAILGHIALKRLDTGETRTRPVSSLTLLDTTGRIIGALP